MAKTSEKKKWLKLLGFGNKRDFWILLISWAVASIAAVVTLLTNTDLDSDLQGILIVIILFPVLFSAGILYAGLVKWACERKRFPFILLLLLVIWFVTLSITYGINQLAIDWNYFYVVDIALVAIFTWEIMVSYLYQKLFCGKNRILRIGFLLSYIGIAFLFYWGWDSGLRFGSYTYLSQIYRYVIIGTGIGLALGFVFLLMMVNAIIHKRFKI